ncbi:MAG: metalloregulator ArsR/SmtB family transcription factor [Pseudomonadota bacterium]
MARLKTTNDVFNAIAEPKRRKLIELIAGREIAVGNLVDETRWPQPAVSKHLAVLREVGLVSERKEGRCRIYRIEPDKLRPIQEWIHQFEEYWGGTFDQLETYLDTVQRKGEADDDQS